MVERDILESASDVSVCMGVSHMSLLLCRIPQPRRFDLNQRDA